MFRAFMTASLLMLPHVGFAGTQTDLEAALWNHASSSKSLETLELFIESFPDSEFVEDAETMVSRLKDDQRRRDFENALTGLIGTVTFSSPLEFGDESIVGFSIEEIIKMKPHYPPVEGLPEEHWKTKTCASCHQWTRENLCVQANTYASSSPSKQRTKLHPFGAPFKINLSIWAKNGCR